MAHRDACFVAVRASLDVECTASLFLPRDVIKAAATVATPPISATIILAMDASIDTCLGKKGPKQYMLAAKQRKVAGMPRDPKGKKRPANVNARAVMIGKIATGEIEDTTTDDGKNPAAVALGRMGGKARAEGLSARKRRDIARKAAESRWKKSAD